MMRRGLPFLLLASAACLAPETRLPLPAPFLPTYGATPVPGSGAAVAAEWGNGLLGPELVRGEMRSSAFGVGLGNRLNILIATPRAMGSRDNVGGVRGSVGVQQFRAKLTFRRPFGRKSALAIYGGHAYGGRFAEGPGQPPSYAPDTLQRDRVWSWEVAAPAELLFGSRAAEILPSIYLGPRLTFMRYEDRVRPDGNFKALFAGAVGGFHVSAGRYEFFLESAAVHVPRHAYAGGWHGGGVALLPAFGAVMRIGSPYFW
jgi:hypothetical protein